MKKMVGKRTGRQEGMGTEEKQEQKGARERGKDQSVNQSFLSFSSLREVNCFFALKKYPRSFNPLHAMLLFFFFYFLFNIYHPSKILTFSESIISKPYTTTTNQYPNTTTKANKQAKNTTKTSKQPNYQTSKRHKQARITERVFLCTMGPVRRFSAWLLQTEKRSGRDASAEENF